MSNDKNILDVYPSSGSGGCFTLTLNGGNKWGYAISHSTVSSDTFGNNSLISFNIGGDSYHNNIQPYIVTYMWRRVS